MRENPRADLKNIENWSKNNAPNVALQLGYVLNKRFIRAVTEYGKDLRRSNEMEQIKVTDFIPVFGERFLREYTPPLKRDRK
ncbi:MAG: hypothetical protein NTZ55_03825 [Candidatus Roizmanbacteria bacterium]|nr:hypothetical protein [Candidatus Roizmanbacteria bacterium]